MRPYIDWIRATRDRYLEALEELKDDEKISDPADTQYIAAASAIVYQFLLETQVHEGEILNHLYKLHGKERPAAG